MLGLAADHSNGTGWIFSYLIFLERELEFAVIIWLTLFLGLNRYYGLVLEQPLNSIAFGIGFYSSFVIIKSTILLAVRNIPWPWVSPATTVGFSIAAGVWCAALRVPFPERVAPELVTAESYERSSRDVSRRMRELNERLSGLMN